jgi:hypothetical protein
MESLNQKLALVNISSPFIKMVDVKPEKVRKNNLNLVIHSMVQKHLLGNNGVMLGILVNAKHLWI